MSATKHLLKNFKALQEDPLVGANAMFFESDIFIWYCIVVGPNDSSYAGIPIRFVLEFDNNYPNSPPKAFFDTYFAYSGGAQMRDDRGRIGVCLDIFGNFGMVHTEWKNNVGSGWSASYTIATILVTMQCLLSDMDLISTSISDIEKTRQSSLLHRCSMTGHDGSDPSKWVPQIFMTNDDIVNFKALNGIIKGDNRKYNPLVDDYICYITKENKQDGTLLGFGIHVENARSGVLSSTCEYLSKSAFDNGTRQSTIKKPFEYWLPILIDSLEWPAVKQLFIDSILDISKALNLKSSIHINIIKICSSIMNSLVVEIMNAKNNVTANDKFINGYFSIYRLLKQYASENIEYCEYVDFELLNFNLSLENRQKIKVPNLGELLIFLIISHEYSWNSIKTFFLEESDARNVFWYTVGNNYNRPRHPELINFGVPMRSSKVFSATETSRKLIMYQVEFSRIAKSITLDVMDSNFGMAPIDIRDKLKCMYNQIDEVVDWNGYMTWLDLPSLTDIERDKQLEDALTLSNTQGYTGSSKSVIREKQQKKHYRKKY